MKIEEFEVGAAFWDDFQTGWICESIEVGECGTVIHAVSCDIDWEPDGLSVRTFTNPEKIKECRLIIPASLRSRSR